MALTKTIETILPEVKQHLRIFHTEDDLLIKNEIEVAILDIHTIIMLVPEEITDSNGDKITNPDFPADVDDNTGFTFDARVLLAIKHYTTMLRTNPDERIEIRSGAKTTTNFLIERILGSKHGYFKEY